MRTLIIALTGLHVLVGPILLKAALRRADGILLSTPVYFGDRSSLSQRFIETIRSDAALCRDLAGRIYAGLAVGAKRNGGQETTLIYQMMDMVEADPLNMVDPVRKEKQLSMKDAPGASMAVTMVASSPGSMRSIPRLAVGFPWSSSSNDFAPSVTP